MGDQDLSTYLRIDEIVVITELGVIISKHWHRHALPVSLLLAEGDVLDAKLIPLIVVVDVAAHVTEVAIGTGSGSSHIIDLIAKVEILLALSSQLLAVVLVPSQDIRIGTLAELVHFVR